MEYTLLGIALMLHAAVTMKAKQLKKMVLIRSLSAFIIGAAYAVTDEFHQSFVGDRAVMATDVCIDSGGVLFGVVIILSITLIKQKRFN